MNHPIQDLTRTTEAYNQRACEYTKALGNIGATSPVDQDRILHWADTKNGIICDLGSGPGH